MLEILGRIGEVFNLCFLANGISFIAVITGLLLMTVREQRREGGGSPLQSIQEGLQYATVTRPVRALLLLGLISICAMPTWC